MLRGMPSPALAVPGRFRWLVVGYAGSFNCCVRSAAGTAAHRCQEKTHHYSWRHINLPSLAAETAALRQERLHQGVSKATRQR